MKRLLLFFAALLMAAPVCLADEDDEEVITFPVDDIGEITLGTKYTTTSLHGFAATLHVKESGLLRVMSSSSDFPYPYADPSHVVLHDFLSSFYDGAQGYVMKVWEGDVIYFYRNFCMGSYPVWFEMQSAELTFSSSPAVGERLLPTGRAQLELLFNMPVATDGGTMTCGGKTVELGARSGFLYIIYEIKDIIMRWLDEGVAPDTPIDVTLHNVHAHISDDIKYGDDGTLRLQYRMPAMPGKLVGCNFAARTFKSYWLDDDPEGVFRMTFTKPVSTTSPGYLSVVYGNAEAMDINQLIYEGRAEGNDVVFDLRGINLRPKDFLDSGNVYSTISLHPGGVCDENGELMYSEGTGTLASWTYELPYLYLSGTPRWEVTDADENDIDRLDSGDGVLLYVYYYNLVKSDGILLTFDDGETLTIPLSDIEVSWESNGTTAELYFEMPEVRNASEHVTISFDHLRLLTGEAADGLLSDTFPWTPSITTGLSAVGSVSASGAYDLSGRRVGTARKGVKVSRGRKEVR